MSKVRIYDLAKELKLDNKKVIEEVRRFGCDVNVPSNSVPPDIAEKVKSKYFPQKSKSERRVILVKHRAEDFERESSLDVADALPPQIVADNTPPVVARITSNEVTKVAETPHIIEEPEARITETRPPSSSSTVIKVVKKVEASAPILPTAVSSQPATMPSPSVSNNVEDLNKSRIVRIEPPKIEPPTVKAPEIIAEVAPKVGEIPPLATVIEDRAVTVAPPVNVPAPTHTPTVTPAVAPSSPSPATNVNRSNVVPGQSKTQIIPLQPPPNRPPNRPATNFPPAGRTDTGRPGGNQTPGQSQSPRPPQQDNRPYQQDNRPYQQNNRPPQQDNRPYQQDNRPYQQNNRPPQQDNRPYPQDNRPSQPNNRPYQQDNRPPQPNNRPYQQDNRPPQPNNRPYQQDSRPAYPPQDNRPSYPQDNRPPQGQRGGPFVPRGQAPQRPQGKPNPQVIHRITTQPDELQETQRTTYIPPPDPRKKSRRGATSAKPTAHTKREDREKLPNIQPPPTATSLPRIVAPKELKSTKVVEGCTVKEFAEKLEIKPKDVVALLLSKGVMATINQTLNTDVAREIGKEFGYEIQFAGFEEMTSDAELEDTIELVDEVETRAPVVTVMGHVDHGKTSLLDAIRKTRVAEGEAGGITQHIGAYRVNVPDPDNPEHIRKVIFLDTPGHEAFTMMRARGAKATDVVVLVVAADDGVMPQTIEAIEHAKAAGVPIVVAINKIDKPQAQPDRVKQMLSEHGLVWDGWGGDTVMVEVSAKQRINLNNLLEMILLSADILDLKASPKRLGTGVVLEAKLDKGRGAVATVLIQNGSLKIGEPVIAGLFFGRVRAMVDDRGNTVQSVGPSTPVEVLGLQGVPSAGDQFQVVTDVAKAQQISMFRQSKKRILELSRSSAQRLEDLFSAMQAGKLKELLVILKTDVQGSVEVLKDTLQKLSTDKVKVRVIRSGVGAITESDVLLATASNDMAHSAVIIGFNVRPEQRAEEMARQENVDMRLHSVIYKIEEEIRNAMLGMLEATIKEVPLGKAEIRQIIKVPKAGNIAGVMVIEGLVKRTGKLRLVRDGAIVFEGQVSSLRRFKDDVSEVKQGFECGIGIDRYSDIKIGDIIEVYITEKVAQTEL